CNGRKHTPGRDDPIELGKYLLLEGEILVHSFDNDVHAIKALITFDRLNQVEPLLDRASRQSPTPDRRFIVAPNRRHPAFERRPIGVGETNGQTRVGARHRGASAHWAGSANPAVIDG